MDKDFLIQLTNNLYRLTLFFPKKEPLRYKMREVAADILAKCLNSKFKQEGECNIEQNPVLKDLEVLDSFFEVARAQNWVSPGDILKVQQEYSKLKEESTQEKTEDRPLPVFFQKEKEITIPEKKDVMATRQEKILEFLKENGKTQVWQTKQIFPEVSKRTLRRDFESLLKQGKIERIGERNNTFYQLRG